MVDLWIPLLHISAKYGASCRARRKCLLNTGQNVTLLAASTVLQAYCQCQAEAMQETPGCLRNLCQLNSWRPNTSKPDAVLLQSLTLEEGTASTRLCAVAHCTAQAGWLLLRGSSIALAASSLAGTILQSALAAVTSAVNVSALAGNGHDQNATCITASSIRLVAVIIAGCIISPRGRYTLPLNPGFLVLVHMNIRMHPAASWKRPGNWALIPLNWGQSNTQWSSSPTACVSQTVHRRRWRGRPFMQSVTQIARMWA